MFINQQYTTTMQKYSLEELKNGGNKSIGELTLEGINYPQMKQKAIRHFTTLHPELKLNENGYAKHGDTSFIIVDIYDPLQSCYHN